MEGLELELTGTRPPSVASYRPPSAHRPRSGYHTVADKSSVDELLFSSHHPRNSEEISFKSPWDSAKEKTNKSDKPRGKPLLWTPTERTSFSARSQILKTSNRNALTRDFERHQKYKPLKHTPTYVDETLFGPKLEEPSFRAPWAEKVKRPKPFLFSPIDYTKLERESTTDKKVRYSSAGTMDGRPPSRQGRRPVTATTRPVTVESTYDIERPTWKP